MLAFWSTHIDFVKSCDPRSMTLAILDLLLVALFIYLPAWWWKVIHFDVCPQCRLMESRNKLAAKLSRQVPQSLQGHEARIFPRPQPWLSPRTPPQQGNLRILEWSAQDIFEGNTWQNDVGIRENMTNPNIFSCKDITVSTCNVTVPEFDGSSDTLQ